MKAADCFVLFCFVFSFAGRVLRNPSPFCLDKSFCFFYIAVSPMTGITRIPSDHVLNRKAPPAPEAGFPGVGSAQDRRAGCDFEEHSRSRYGFWRSGFVCLFRQAMDIWLRELPSFPILQWYHRIPHNETYWKNWPTAQNPYINSAYWHRTWLLVEPAW